jgi:hypothetical protein
MRRRLLPRAVPGTQLCHCCCCCSAARAVLCLCAPVPVNRMPGLPSSPFLSVARSGFGLRAGMGWPEMTFVARWISCVGQAGDVPSTLPGLVPPAWRSCGVPPSNPRPPGTTTYLRGAEMAKRRPQWRTVDRFFEHSPLDGSRYDRLHPQLVRPGGVCVCGGGRGGKVTRECEDDPTFFEAYGRQMRLGTYHVKLLILDRKLEKQAWRRFTIGRTS